MNPNRKRRAKGLGTGGDGPQGPDPELMAMSDADLIAEHEVAKRAAEDAERERAAGEADPLFGHLRHLPDVELLAEYEAARAQVAAALPTWSDEALLARSNDAGITDLVAAEIARRRPKVVEPPTSVAEPPEEIHAVEVREPTPPEPQLSPREEWDRKVAEGIAAAIAEESAMGELRARLDHEAAKRAPSETMGPSELLDALGHDNRRGG